MGFLQISRAKYILFNPMDTDVIFGAWVPTGGLFCPSGYCCSKAPKWDPQWLKLFYSDNNQIFVVKNEYSLSKWQYFWVRKYIQSAAGGIDRYWIGQLLNFDSHYLRCFEQNPKKNFSSNCQMLQFEKPSWVWRKIPVHKKIA